MTTKREQLALIDRFIAETEAKIIQMRTEIESFKNRGIDTKQLQSALRKLQFEQAQRYRERDKLAGG